MTVHILSPNVFFFAILLVALIILSFWIWALLDMLGTRKLSKVQKGVWFILFLSGTLITAIVWWVVRK